MASETLARPLEPGSRKFNLQLIGGSGCQGKKSFLKNWAEILFSAEL
jgi:hypothetical protein